jgi:hypothetical protein
MAKKQKEQPQKVTINDVDYNVDDLTQEQIAMVNHVADLDRKISSSQFNIDQLNVGRGAFMNMLTDSLKDEVEEAEEVVDWLVAWPCVEAHRENFVAREQSIELIECEAAASRTAGLDEAVRL